MYIYTHRCTSPQGCANKITITATMDKNNEKPTISLQPNTSAPARSVQQTQDQKQSDFVHARTQVQEQTDPPQMGTTSVRTMGQTDADKDRSLGTRNLGPNTRNLSPDTRNLEVLRGVKKMGPGGTSSQKERTSARQDTQFDQLKRNAGSVSELQKRPPTICAYTVRVMQRTYCLPYCVYVCICVCMCV